MILIFLLQTFGSVKCKRDDTEYQFDNVGGANHRECSRAICSLRLLLLAAGHGGQDNDGGEDAVGCGYRDCSSNASACLGSST